MKTFSLLGLALLSVAFIACGFGSKGSAPNGSGAPAVSETPAKKVYTREEFKALVVGKSQDEIMKLLGRPAKTSEYGDGTTGWKYEGITVDPISQKMDNTAYADFDRSKICTRVSY